MMDQTIDAYLPQNIAERVENVGVKKANLTIIPLLALSILAGAFISFGAMFYSVVITDSGFGFGPSRLLGGSMKYRF